MCEICFDIERTIIMHLSGNRGRGKKYMSFMHLNSEWRTLLPWLIFMPAR